VNDGFASSASSAFDEVELGRRIDLFRERVDVRIALCGPFEDAAQSFADALYTDFQDIVVLARVFAVIPLRQLDTEGIEYLAATMGTAAATSLDPSTPVLALFGTRGIERAWNHRTLSRDHRAIALVSAAFVEEAPMLAKLFAEIDAAPGLPTRGDWQFVRTVSDGDGLFFVGDARTTTDPRGRRVIPADDFVERYGVRTVFGFGSRAADDDITIAVIIFCRKSLMRSVAFRFAQLIESLRDGASRRIASGALFSDPQADADPA
jgi:hypothetical protein